MRSFWEKVVPDSIWIAGDNSSVGRFKVICFEKDAVIARDITNGFVTAIENKRFERVFVQE